MVRTFTGAWIETIPVCLTLCQSGVRTFTGAWIETGYRASYRAGEWFAPSRVRGLKLVHVTFSILYVVRTFTGAWIETMMSSLKIVIYQVRTFTGAWIETSTLRMA